MFNSLIVFTVRVCPGPQQRSVKHSPRPPCWIQRDRRHGGQSAKGRVGQGRGAEGQQKKSMKGGKGEVRLSPIAKFPAGAYNSETKKTRNITSSHGK